MMSKERAKQILASYGGQPEQWPSTERLSLQQLLLSDAELQFIQQQALQLDAQFAKMAAAIEQTNTQQLEQTIMASLPERAVVKNSQTTGSNIRGIYQTISSKFNNLIRFDWIVAAVTVSMLIAIGIVQFNNIPVDSNPADAGDELLLMAEALDNYDELELFGMLEPELLEDSI